MDEHEQYPTLRELAESAEDGIEVPAVIVRELFAERDALVAERDRLLTALDGTTIDATALVAERADLEDEVDRLRAVVEDITAHATPIAEDDDGFVAVGYTVTIGAIHRALAALQGAAVDPLHPPMPTGEGQVFGDWLDFVERVARPIVEIENDDAAEQAAMALYRKASPFFICAALVMAANCALGVSAVMGDPPIMCRWCHRPIVLLPAEQLPINEPAWVHVDSQPGTGRRNQIQCEPDMQSMVAEPNTDNFWQCRCGTKYNLGCFVCPNCGTARQRTPGSAESWDAAAGEKP